ncbi:spermidine synthase [Lampropedia puyangensis]|nr:fused MFS/spermidine synthase [Lampropedia puyangensis]
MSMIGIVNAQGQTAPTTSPVTSTANTIDTTNTPPFSLENDLMKEDFHLATTVRGQHLDVMVMEGEAFRCMSFDRRNLFQSCMLKAQPEVLALEYTRGLLAGMHWLPRPPQRILLIGMGGGSIPKALMQYAPDAKVDVVELDAAVVQVAQDCFGFQPTPSMRVHVMDARVFVRQQIRQQQTYDLIMLDAFDHDYIPEHLLTVEFLSQIRQLLAADGIVVANTFARGRLLPHEEATWQAVFPSLWRAKRLENDILYAATQALTLQSADDPLDALTGRWDDYPAQPVPPSTARPLTDQWSPTNLLRHMGADFSFDSQ